jgi:hypothetical protein
MALLGKKGEDTKKINHDKFIFFLHASLHSVVKLLEN